MSLKNANNNESDSSLLDLSKLSKESKKRRIRKKNKEIANKIIPNAPPTIFKNTEIELNENMLNYIHKLEFLIGKSFDQLKSEHEKFKDFLYCIAKNYDLGLEPLIKELETSDPLHEARQFNFFDEILRKYDPSLIPKVSQKISKPKMRNKSLNIINQSDKYNIIKFSLNNNNNNASPPNNSIPQIPLNIKEKPEKKSRKRNSETNKPGNGNNSSGNSRKQVKKEENLTPSEMNLMNPSNFLGQSNYKNMNFPPFFNANMTNLPQQGFGFMNNPQFNQNPQQEQENNTIGMDLAQKFSNLSQFNLYTLLNDPNNKDLMGLYSAMLADPTNDMMQNNMWNSQFNANLDPTSFLKKMKDSN